MDFLDECINCIADIADNFDESVRSEKVTLGLTCVLRDDIDKKFDQVSRPVLRWRLDLGASNMSENVECGHCGYLGGE